MRTNHLRLNCALRRVLLIAGLLLAWGLPLKV